MENNKNCSVAGCTNTLGAYNATGMCGWHSTRAHKHLPLDPCSVEGCANYDVEATVVERKCFHHAGEVK